LQCDLSEVTPARLEVREFLQEQGVGEIEISACELALAEACNNAIQNATREGRESPIDIVAVCTPSQVELHVNDHTPGFDWPDKVPLPSLDAEHGRGLFFIQACMDTADYIRGPEANRLMMRKSRTTPPVTAPAAERDEGVQLELRSRLAESQQALTEMARELCFRSETLAAICRCSADLGRSNDLKGFAERLLDDLLHIAAAEWFVVRTINPSNQLSTFVASIDRGNFTDLPLNQKGRRVVSLEAHSARSREDVEFGPEHPLASEDPLWANFPESCGFIHPIRMDETLIGTLAIGRSAVDGVFSVRQREVIRTFADFLAIQVLNARLQEQQLSNRLVSHELEIARGIQRSLLPKQLPQLRGFGLAASCETARQVGGDFYDLLQISPTSVLLVIADVMGKGVPAALFAALLRSVIRANPEWSSSPAEVLTRINHLLFEDLSRVSMFITAQIVLLDLERRRAVVGGAGHCPLLFTTPASKVVNAVASQGMPLGVVRNASFEESVIPLESGARLLLYTDGVTESRNPAGEQFGQKRLESWLGASWKSAESAEALKAGLSAALKEFESNSPPGDDRTFLIAADQDQNATPTLKIK